MSESRPFPGTLVSVVIPARNEGSHIAETVRSVSGQASAGLKIEVIVVDDGSTDDTAERARRAGAAVIQSVPPGSPGNPGAARNRGAKASTGDPIVFLDADCVPRDGWLEAILDAHKIGATVVGGSLEMPPGLSYTARCDYYCGWYLVHSGRPAGFVPHLPAPNLSVRRDPFLQTSGFSIHPPLDYSQEERAWQSELQRSGHRMYFEPKAVVFHRNRSGFGNLLRRNYRWGYSAIESKSRTGVARMAWLYRFPWIPILLSPLLALTHTGYILVCWLQAGRIEPLLMLPSVLVSRLAYMWGLVVGGIRWILHRRSPSTELRPGPRWR
jgi:glycosyltransferase involved in cell wall biosynthesis